MQAITYLCEQLVDRTIAIADKYGIYVAIVTVIGLVAQMLFINY